MTRSRIARLLRQGATFMIGAATAAGIGVAALAGTGTLAVAQDIPGQVTDEIREFCANIVDAARDRRYAVQTRELETLRKQIDERVAALEAKRAEYEDWLARRDEVINRAEDSVVGIYARMRPDAAAERMAKLDPNLAAALILKLNSRQAGLILNEMDSQAAARLTSIIADVAKSEDPT
jgi:flagellar motility protein MotE (MotC chaperone)